MLNICRKFFSELEKENIIYVHWKSNEHLIEDLNGESDLDLLLRFADKYALEKVFESLDIKRFEAKNDAAYDGIEDYIGYDEESGKIIHFHIHFKLIIGLKYLKEYHLPWEEIIFKTRIKHPKTDIWIINHELELLLLIIREALRINFSKLFKLKTFHHSEKAKREFDWLKSKHSENQFNTFSQDLIREKETILLVSATITNGLKEEFTIKLRSKFQRIFRSNIRFNLVKLSLLKTKRLIKKTVYVILYRVLNYTPEKRVSPRNGLVVALVGSDGSGKSTMASELKKFYQKKITVKMVYFGQYKANNTLFKLILRLLYKLNLKPIINLRFKQRQFRKTQKYNKKGYLVICDRFPQNQYGMIMDGPMLAEKRKSANPFLRILSRREEYFYKELVHAPLKIVFKLLIDEDTAVKREAISRDLAKEKVKITRDLYFDSGVNVVSIDHTHHAYSIRDVKHIMTNEIWKEL